MSTIYLYRREYDMAEQHIIRACDLNPNDAEAQIGRGRLLTTRGRPEEALAFFHAAFRLNPLYEYSTGYNALFGVALYSLRRFEEAAHVLKRMWPNSWSRARLAACYGQLDRTAETLAAREEVLRLQPDFSTAGYMRNSVLLERAEDQELLREGLIKAGLPE
jgi:tetratricopeptide (TPR) repeat protein